MMISKVPGIYGIYLRENYYKSTLKKCGKNLQVHYGAYILYSDVEIGDDCAIEDYCFISRCVIGNNVIFAARCSVMSGAHHHDVDDLSNIFRKTNLETKKIILGDNLWIGTHSVIMNNVASNTVVGAGAVITKEFDEYSVLMGVPARFIRKRGKR